MYHLSTRDTLYLAAGSEPQTEVVTHLYTECVQIGTLGPPATTFGYGSAQLRALCDAAGFGNSKGRIVGTFEALAKFCKDRNLDLPPRWSGVTDDCTPFEFSIAIGGGPPSIRFLLETQDDPASPATYWTAGMRLTKWLARTYGVDLKRFDRVKDLFVPTDPLAYSAIWHGADFRLGGLPLFKVYLFPAAQGRIRADTVVREAISRLGFSHLWPSLLNLRGQKDVFNILSLDLSSESRARVKVYIRHRDAMLGELEARCGLACDNVPGDWSSFCRVIAGGQDPLSLRPIGGVYHLTSEEPDRITRAVLSLPLFPYAENDQVAYIRIRRLLADFDLPDEVYARCVKAFASAPLDSEKGLHTYVSFQREAGRPRITLYFGSRVYYKRYGCLALDPERCWPSPAHT